MAQACDHEHDRVGNVLTEVFAHRGSTLLARENTIEAFDAAVADGADGIELDVRRTVDGALVVHHDVEVPRLGAIARMRAAELPGWLPGLDDALDACGGLKVNVEIKHEPLPSSLPATDRSRLTSPDGDVDVPAELLAAEVARCLAARGDRDRMIVSSFSLAVVDAVIATSPGLESAWLVDLGSDVRAAVGIARLHGHRGLHPHHISVDTALVGAGRAAGLAVRAWTVDDPGRVAELQALGVDAVITNDVRAALRALGR